MGKIVKLDENLSNKIAAGEVVERPASIVKELVENAIDANSTNINIEIEEAGLQKIQIVDNGDGIEREDCLLAFDRHATSKIKNDKDLFRINTLGFRGEALPSIASVSHLEMKTCTSEGPGTHVVIEGGRVVTHQTAASRKGTDITITNLFYNTPARLKYLKTVHTELGHITDYIYRLALAYPSVAFRLEHNGKEVFSSNGKGDLLQVIASIYGTSVAKKMIYIENENLDFKVKGYVCKPEMTRASRQYVSTFINQRYIRNYPLTKAIQTGFHTLLPIGRFPIVVLDISMDPILIDVNVHPSKLEVRLSKEDELNHLVTESIKSAFKEVQLIPAMKSHSYEKPKAEQLKLTITHEDNVIKDEPEPIPATQAVVREKTEEIDTFKNVVEIRDEDMDKARETKEMESEMDVARSVDQQQRVPVLYPIGQMHGTYILAQNDQGLYIIDQHAAQERIKYEYYREKVGQVENELQDLLVPLTYEFTQVECDRIKENTPSLEEVGLFLEPFGQQSFLVRSYPTWFPKGIEKVIIQEIIETVIRERKINIKKLREEAAILMACKASIKANRYLRNDEMFSLLETLRKCEDPFTCPHGRPIFIQFTTYEMEKMFKRIM